MKLQRKLGNDRYIDVEEKYWNNLLEAAVSWDKKYPDDYRNKLGLTSTKQAASLLEQGQELRYGSDWCDKIRDGEAHERALAIAKAKRNADPNYSDTGWKLDCGHTVYWRSHIMSSSQGSSCTDCYGRMSN